MTNLSNKVIQYCDMKQQIHSWDFTDR